MTEKLQNVVLFVTLLKQVNQDVAFFGVQVWRQVRVHLQEDEQTQGSRRSAPTESTGGEVPDTEPAALQERARSARGRGGR